MRGLLGLLALALVSQGSESIVHGDEIKTSLPSSISEALPETLVWFMPESRGDDNGDASRGEDHRSAELGDSDEVSGPSPAAAEYIGCYSDDSSRDFKVGPKMGLIWSAKYDHYMGKKGTEISKHNLHVNPDTPHTLYVSYFRDVDTAEPIKECQKKCSSYKYFALQARHRVGLQCFCDNSYATQTESKKAVYLGCYKDNPQRDLKKGPRRYGYTPDSCARDSACKGFKYIALQHGGWCQCDNSYSTPSWKYPKKPDSDCDTKGKGLGGGWRNAIYIVKSAPVSSSAQTASPYVKKPDKECSLCHAKYGKVLWGGEFRNAVYRTSPSTTKTAAKKKAGALQPGMLITLKSGKNKRYCSIGSEGTICASMYAGMYEMLQVLDAGNGKVAFTVSQEGKTVKGKFQVPAGAAVVNALGGNKISLQVAGKYCSDDGGSQKTSVRCESDKVGEAETFEWQCLRDCPSGVAAQPVRMASESSQLTEAAKYHSFNDIQADEKPSGKSINGCTECSKFLTASPGQCAPSIFKEGLRGGEHSVIDAERECSSGGKVTTRVNACTQCKKDQAFVMTTPNSRCGTCYEYDDPSAGKPLCRSLHPKYNLGDSGGPINDKYKNRMCTKFNRVTNNLLTRTLGSKAATAWFNKPWPSKRWPSKNGAKTYPLKGMELSYVEATCDARKEVVCVGKHCSVKKSVKCREICVACHTPSTRHPRVGKARWRWGRLARHGHVWCHGENYHHRVELPIVENSFGTAVMQQGVSAAPISLKKLNELWKDPKNWPTKGPKWERGNPGSVGVPFVACSKELCANNKTKGEYGGMACQDVVVML